MHAKDKWLPGRYFLVNTLNAYLSRLFHIEKMI